jgi:hypothetical protein
MATGSLPDTVPEVSTCRVNTPLLDVIPVDEAPASFS